jgi:pSer/pThr/pTyr-binding forkhead associated (FHA) protein
VNDDPALTTVFVDRKATKRKLRKSRLVVEDGPQKGKRLNIASERMTIGRSGICDLQLTDNGASGTHCEIIAKETGFLLRDLGSTNGTWVAGVRVREALGCRRPRPRSMARTRHALADREHRHPFRAWLRLD